MMKPKIIETMEFNFKNILFTKFYSQVIYGCTSNKLNEIIKKN